MITAVIRGGLGNQLFQYASAYSLSKRLNQKLTLDTSFYPNQALRGYKLDKLCLSEHFTTSGKNDDLLIRAYKDRRINGIIRRLPIHRLPIKDGVYLVDHVGSFTQSFFSVNENNVLLNGYYQSEEYFMDVRTNLLSQINPSYKMELEYVEALSEIKDTSESVAVHIRHGDFLKKDGSNFHYILSLDYYRRAIQLMREMLGAPTFFCFSDDIDWVKENLDNSDSFVFVSLNTKNPDIDEMMLMKNCDHIITANSTFSWWAAWLNENDNAIKVVPEKAYGNDHMIPKSWIKVSYS